VIPPDSNNPETRQSSPGGRALPLQVHAIAWGAIVVLVLLLIGVSQHFRARNVWSGWTESAELRRPAYTERVYSDDFFRTQANTWSNLAYVLVGLYALGLGWHDLRRKRPADAGYLVSTPGMSLLFGASCCYLGFGSGSFHASLTRLGQQLDVAAMYSPLVVSIAINVGRWIPRLKTGARGASFPTWPILACLVLVASFLLYQYKWSMRSGVVMRNLILATAGFALLDLGQRRRKLPVPWMLLATVALIAARICWQLDVTGSFSGPDAWLQGHAVWHLLTALSLASMYLYYRFEIVLDRPAEGVGKNRS
jgi:hypothetical protein